MKKTVVTLLLFTLLPVAQAGASDVGFNVGVSVGRPVAPVYGAPPVVIAEPPEFIAPPQLGFYVAVGVPYDLFFHGNQYWLNRGGIWYVAPYYNGPWVAAGPGRVPYEIRRYPARKIHYYRDNYYSSYHGRGGPEYRHFRPGNHEMGRIGHEERGDRGRGHGDSGEGHGRWR